jgi:hypothetical protein
MRRRLVGLGLVGILGLVVLSACGRAGGGPGSGPGGDPPLTWPPTGEPQLVASYLVGGGFVPYGWHLMEGPKVVVYSDGLAIADSTKSLVLAARELSDLVLALRDELAGFGPTASAGAENQVTDAPTTTLTVQGANGTLMSVSAYALSEMTGYSPRLVAARDRLEALGRRVLADGAAYTGDTVRVVAQEQESTDATVIDWPAGVALPPPVGEGSGLRRGDLTGEQAAAVAAKVPDTWRTGPWPVLRTADGKLYGVAWRYLVPDE